MSLRAPLLASAAVALSWMHGCEQQDFSSPPPLRLGRDECAECGMLINDDRFAAAMLLERQGEPEYLLFDDIGCLLVFQPEDDSAVTIIREYVQNRATGRWLDLKAATILRASNDRMPTPMGSGLVAFGDAAAAMTAQNEFGGEIVDPELLRADQRKPLVAP